MNPSSARNHSKPRQPDPQPMTSSPSEDAFHVPPIEKDAEGPDVTNQPGAEAGHYGMGYGDPTVHQGGTWPKEGAGLPPAKDKGGGQQ